MHRLGRQGSPVEAPGAQPDHLLLAIDDLEREVRPDLHHNHVDGIGADVDGGNAHPGTFNIMGWAEPASHTMHSARSDLLRKYLDHFTSAVNRAAKGDVTALHRTRGASRRLRELIPVLQLDHNVARKLGRRLRKITRRLGAIRELDVLLLLIDE